VAKIQVQGLGMYDDKTLKKKIIQLASDLQKNAKKGDWSKASENGIRALGRMWGAYQDWARNNESVQNEATRYSGPPTIELGKLKDAIKLFQKKIKKQGHVTNARDAEHLKNLIKIYKQMGGKGVKESVYKFRGMNATDMDEFDAQLSRDNVKGTPDFNKMTYTIHSPKKSVYLDYYIKTKYKKFKPKRIRESKTSDMMKAIRKHGTAGPWDIIISKNNKIVKRVSVKNLKEIPAEMDDVKKKYPNHKIGIEAKSGKIAYREQVLNERIKTAFMVHPEDPDKTERHWVKVFNELAQGHPSPIDYGPRETHMYDWNDRRNYDLAISEYNKMMNKIANGLNKSLDQMNNIWKEWDKIYKKYLKKDGRK